MTELVLSKTTGNILLPADPQTAEFIAKLKAGFGLRGEFRKARNLLFHKKYFALLNIAFDAWEPATKEHRGMQVQKNFDRFRKDIAISSGFYELVVNLKGEVRAEAKSIAFDSMDDEEFADLYSKSVDVILARILTTYKREDVDHIVDTVMQFT